MRKKKPDKYEQMMISFDRTARNGAYCDVMDVITYLREEGDLITARNATYSLIRQSPLFKRTLAKIRDRENLGV